MTSQYTSTCVRTASILGSNSASQQGGFRASSPPQTPQNRQTRRMRSQTGPRVPAHPKRETFLDDITPVDGVRDEEGGDEKDPHDLAFSPKLMTRASLVDNMLMALDQFSNSAPNTFVSREPNATLRYNRQRGNTFSSNASSDYDFRTDENLPPHSFHRGRGSNSNSNALYPRSLETVHSVYEEDEPSSRSRVLESQTAYASLDPRWSGHSKSGRKSGKSSGSSSVDLGQALSGYKLGAAGNRRSQSFDFGSDRRRLPIFQSETNVTGNSYDLSAEMEAAPTPIIHAGPSRGHSPTRHNTTAPLAPVYDPVSAGGRNSTKASKNQPARKGRAGTVGTVVTKNGDDLRNNLENLPPMPSYFPPPPQSPALPSRKLSQVAPADLAQSSKDRPGFFRRVFGSKSTNVINLQASDSENSIARAASTTSLDDETFRAMAAPAKLQKPSSKDANPTTSAAGKEQTISKKSSAFFRRRKKSVTQQMPPPPPLSLHPVRTEAAEQSPVSSLRQVMDAYLVSTSLKSPNWDSREDSIQGFNTAYASSTQRNDGLPANIEKTQDSPHEPEQTISKPLTPASRANLNLKIPQRDNQDSTFLADSSGTEEINSRSRENTPSRWSDGKARSSPSITSHDPFSEGSLPIRFPPTSAGNSVSSETKTPHSSPSPSVPHSGILAKSPRPSQLKLQRGASDNSSPRSLSNEPGVRNSPLPLASDSSLYKSAPSTPVLGSNENDGRSPTINITESPRTFRAQPSSEDDREQALKIFENRDENLDPSEASAWLGDSGDARERVRMAYMSLFDWKDVDILSSLRGLCARIALKGESQQVDRMLDAFSKRWCECNANHGFKSTDVVHIICYSILLLNSDLHRADTDQKMTKSQFIRNTLPTIRPTASDGAPGRNTTIRAGAGARTDSEASERRPSFPRSASLPIESRTSRPSVDDFPPVVGSVRPTDRLIREGSADLDQSPNDPGPLVRAPYVGSMKAWESQIESVLKSMYTSISKERLPLFGAKAETLGPPPATNNLLNITGNMLRRTPSTLSKATSEHSRGRAGDCRLGTGRWMPKTRSRPQLHPVSTVGSARTSMDEGSSGWSPSINSTWSKASVGKTLTSVSVDSFNVEGTRNDYQKSIGFANALSQAIIREDAPGVFSNNDEGIKAAPLLDDESLELSGAPWAKEGSLQHKHHLDGVDKRAKDRNWNECFAVIEKGWMRLFSFSINAKSLRVKARDRARAGGAVGGGNWMDNAEEIWKFLLRHTIASALPDPGYSIARPYVWALSLPTGAVHLFQVGTPDIVKEFVSTANYWSARLSKEPMMGGMSNMEFGWSDAVINRALIRIEPHQSMPPVSMPPLSSGSRPSMQSSLRSSLDHCGGSVRPRLQGDKITINEWSPPQQSMTASQLMEVDQLRALQTYVKNVEDELAKHNELRPAMQLAFSTRHPNTTKAMANWEKKSSYLLREIVKFKTYVDSLLLAQREKEKVLKRKGEEKE